MENKELYVELKEIRTKLGELQVILARNTDSLDYHIRRSDMTDKRVDIIEKDFLKARGFVTIGGWLIAAAATTVPMLNKYFGFFK